MKPKEKALDLLNKFGQKMYGDRHWLVIPNKTMQEDVKQCALIAVDEIMEETRDYCDDNYHSVRMIYWTEVKQEINKL